MRGLLVLSLGLGACAAAFGAGVVEGVVDGNGRMASREERVLGFTQIEVGNGIRLEVSQSDGHSVTIQAEENVLRYIRVEKRGVRLHIFVEPGVSLRTRGMTVTVTMPRLEDLRASGGSQVSVSMDNGRLGFAADLSGGARISGEVRAGEVRLSGSGGSHMELGGSAATLRLSGSGGSQLFVQEMGAREATVDLSGGSEARAAVSEALEVKLSGGSRLSYRGSPRLNAMEVSGGSTIRTL